MNIEQLLLEAKNKYPIGTEFKPAHTSQGNDYAIITDDTVFDYANEYITARVNGRAYMFGSPNKPSKYGNTPFNRIVYHNGKWAEVVSFPKQELINSYEIF